MGKKTVIIVCATAVSVVSGSLGVWCVTLPPRSPSGPGDAEVVGSTLYRDLHSQLESTEGKLESALKDIKRLGAVQKELESKLARLDTAPVGGETATPEAAAAPGPAGSGLSWAELSGLIAGNLDLLGKMARNERLDPDEQVKYQALEGELLKLSSKARLQSSEPLFEEPLYSELLAALFREPLALSEKQVPQLEALAGKLLEGLPANFDELSALERHQVRKEIQSRLEQGLEGMLDDDQRQSWEAVRAFARTALSYGGEMTLGTSTHQKNLLVNWWGNALGGKMDEAAMQAVTPAAEAYVERAKAVLEQYGASNEALKELSPQAKANLEAELLRLQKLFYGEASPHLSEEQRRKLHERDPLIIRFEHGASTMVSGRRRFF